MMSMLKMLATTKSRQRTHSVKATQRSDLILTVSVNLLYAFIMPPFEKGGNIALHLSVGMSVGMSVSLNLVQLITQERYAPEASNLVGR